jgi:hypothetical protein
MAPNFGGRSGFGMSDMERGAFEWQLPPPPAPARARQPVSYSELERELRGLQTDDDREYETALAESMVTAFQEQPEQKAEDSIKDEPATPTNPPGYWDSISPFSLEDALMNEKSFLDWFPKGTATITFPGEDGDIVTVPDINEWMFQERCPLLLASFEPSRGGKKLGKDL